MRVQSIAATLIALTLAVGGVPAEQVKGPAAGAAIPTEVVPLDGSNWLLAVDPKEVGESAEWYKAAPAEARKTRVPWVIQDAFPNYHGWAWYWRDFHAPVNPHAAGRYLLRFAAVDYRAEVWVNGFPVGVHEGTEEPFTINVTARVKPGQSNRLAVRVLTPAKPSGRRTDPPSWDNAFNSAGIIDSVQLLVAPAVRIAGIQVVPDWKTGDIRVWTSVVQNASTKGVRGRLQLSIAPAAGGEAAVTGAYEAEFGNKNVTYAILRVPHRRLWELNDPYLYRVTARVQAAGSRSIDECSVRCGFRDFRFQDGYFRFNGRRIRLLGPLLVVLQYPVTQSVPYNENLLRQDVLQMKALGFNCVRICCGAALPARQLDLFDELGLLVMQGHLDCIPERLDSSGVAAFDRSLLGVVRRDRNHPSIVAWEMANEVRDAGFARHLVQALPRLRDEDPSRLVFLNSGKEGRQPGPEIGSISNPGSRVWESNLRDEHQYSSFPLNYWDRIRLRAFSAANPFLLSEHGVCGAQDYPRYLRHFEQLGKEHAVDAQVYRGQMERFMADWKKWRLDQCWARPEDYFRQSQANQAQLALSEYSVWMCNPRMVGSFTSTSVCDAWFHGCGIMNYFRELKPGMAEAYQDMASKVRLCLFTSQPNVYRGAKVRLEAVLVNLDALRPGKYPVRLQVVGPKMVRLLERTISVEVPQPGGGPEPPWAGPIFNEEMAIDGPSGKYRFLATFEHGAAAGGGETEFYVADPADMPAVKGEVLLWGQDSAELANWLAARGIRTRPLAGQKQTAREVILAAGAPPAPGSAVFAELARRVGRGSTVIFLTPETLLEPGSVAVPLSRAALPKTQLPAPHWDDAAGRELRFAPLPAGQRPLLVATPKIAYFRADFWAKEHPLFDGLPCGGIMDYRFYGEMLRPKVFCGGQPPAEAVGGEIQASGRSWYESGLFLSVYRLGAGRFLINSLNVRPNLGSVPVAERLLRNMLNYAAQGADRPLAELPADFAGQLKAME